MGAARSDASIGELVIALLRDSGTLARQELRLASTEMKESARLASRQLGVVALGGALAHAGLLGLLVAAVVGLAQVLPLWLSALIIGAGVLVAGAAVAAKGLRALREIEPKAIETFTVANTPGLSPKELR